VVEVNLRGRTNATSRERRLRSEGAHIGRSAKVVAGAEGTRAGRAQGRAGGLRSAVPVADYVAGRHDCCGNMAARVW